MDPTTPRATYRLQLQPEFGFDDAIEVLPYLACLGISHVYCSPILQAAPGSTHGYDVVDHAQLSNDLGGASGFMRLARAAAAHDLSLVVDIVPNHMALAGSANRWWWDVLQHGPDSLAARHFDIDWQSGPADGPSVLMPVLDDHYGRVLEAGGLVMSREGGSFVVRHHDHELPLSLGSLAAVLAAAASASGSGALRDIVDRLPGDRVAQEAATLELRALTLAEPATADAIDAALAEVQGDPDRLDAVLSAQAYRLALWRTAADELDYRRFFDVTTLVGLRVEDPVVFEDTHRTVLDLVAAGDVTGLRIDHVDGLRDPAGYLERLRAAAPAAWIVVEKILAVDEALPRGWPVAGTSGYDFLDRVGDLFVEPAGARQIAAAFARLTGDDGDFATVAHDSKLYVQRHELAAEAERLTEQLVAVLQPRRRHRDFTRREVRAVVQELVAAMAVYRTYGVPGRPLEDADRRHVEAAVAGVQERRPDLDAELLALVQRILCFEEDGGPEAELAVRFQQLSSPVMAKGVEDTAFYRWTPLLAVTEVGGDPGLAGRGVEPFHAGNAAIAADWPGTMLALSTHDTKRSADVRARLSLLTEIPDAWSQAVADWGRWESGLDGATEALLLQTLVGAWPLTAERLEPVLVKSAQEAKLSTSWREPDQAYLDAVTARARSAIADAGFVRSLEALVAQHDLVRLGRLTSLAQLALLLTSPGVPDTYQGDELWDLSLVDPDNRRPVDFARRAELLEEVVGLDAAAVLARMDEGAPKLWLLHRLLDHRRRSPQRYRSTGYAGLAAEGAKAAHVVAFARDGLVTVAPRLLVGLADDWDDTELALPAGAWTDVLTGAGWPGGSTKVASLLTAFPVAVLERADD